MAHPVLHKPSLTEQITFVEGLPRASLYEDSVLTAVARSLQNIKTYYDAETASRKAWLEMTGEDLGVDGR